MVEFTELSFTIVPLSISLDNPIYPYENINMNVKNKNFNKKLMYV
jgi:hypothetical protein